MRQKCAGSKQAPARQSVCGIETSAQVPDGNPIGLARKPPSHPVDDNRGRNFVKDLAGKLNVISKKPPLLSERIRNGS